MGEATFKHTATPSNPPAGYIKVYPKSDDKLYKLTSGGSESEVGGGTPDAHATSHQNGGSDEINVGGLSGELADNQTPKAHASDHTDGTDDIQNATSSQKGLATAAQISKLDGIEALADITDAVNIASSIVGVSGKTTPADADTIPLIDSADSNSLKELTWANLKSEVGSGSFPFYFLPASRLLVPNNSDWAVQAHAVGSVDSNNERLFVRRFTDDNPEGVGFMLPMPTGATNIIISLYSRAETAPGSTQAVIPSIYECEIDDNGAVTSWSSGVNMTALSMPANEYFQVDSQEISFSTLGLAAGQLHLLELVRNTDSGSDTLSGDWTLVGLGIGFS